MHLGTRDPRSQRPVHPSKGLRWMDGARAREWDESREISLNHLRETMGQRYKRLPQLQPEGPICPHTTHPVMGTQILFGLAGLWNDIHRNLLSRAEASL